MQNLLYFLYRFGYVLLFILLQVISINLVVRYNTDQNAIFISSSNAVSGWFYQKYDAIVQYFQLSTLADKMSQENAALKEQLEVFQRKKIFGSTIIQDTIYEQQYQLIPCKVINNSVVSLDNFITLDKGRNDGIEQGMGVIQENGIVGIVTNANLKYSRVISILNRACRISASVKRTGHFGSLRWPGGSPTRVILEDIPKHAELAIGDEIVTSGYSSIFPENLLIGHIQDFQRPEGGNFYEIEVKLLNDISKVKFAYAVKDLFKMEREQVEGTGE
ncbi:MAG: rod shape-determining protein MreC [Saprospiraceae bacterium]|nr:rod shape-determining protein MreC [Saprospiraceae bacterium]